MLQCHNGVIDENLVGVISNLEVLGAERIDQSDSNKITLVVGAHDRTVRDSYGRYDHI